MPNNDRNTTDVVIFGHKFTLSGASDPEHMRALAAKVDERMKELSRPKPGEPIHRMAIYTALVLMDELGRARAALDAERRSFEQASRSAAHLDLKLQALLTETLHPEPGQGGLNMEEQPEVLELEGMLPPPPESGPL